MQALSGKIEYKMAGVTSTAPSLINSIFYIGENQMTTQSVLKICSIEECHNPVYVHVSGMCKRHYSNLRNYGHARALKELSLKERILLRGWDIQPNGCWHWRGKVNDSGYGIFQDTRAHRLVYTEIAGLPLNREDVLRHKCDNPICVNPEHLEPGTQADNVRDMVERRRHWLHSKTECKRGHSLTDPSNVRIVNHRGCSERVCIQCARARSNKYSRRVRAEAKALGL